MVAVVSVTLAGSTVTAPRLSPNSALTYALLLELDRLVDKLVAAAAACKTKLQLSFRLTSLG